MTTGTLRKLLAALVASPVAVALAALPGPAGKVAAAVVAGVGVYVNWGHSGAQGLADWARSYLVPELPLLLTRLEALENPMIKDDLATLETNLPIIKQALANRLSDDDAAKFKQLAADSQAIVDGLKDGTTAATTSNATSTDADLAGTTPVSTPVADPVGTPVATAPIGGVVTTTDPSTNAPTVL